MAEAEAAVVAAAARAALNRRVKEIRERKGESVKAKDPEEPEVRVREAEEGRQEVVEEEGNTSFGRSP